MKIFTVLSLLLLFSCAKPNYTDDNSTVIQRDVLTGCEFIFSTEELCMKFEWIKQPSESEFGEMKVLFTEIKDDRIRVSPKNNFHFFLWMPSMGHGSSPVQVNEISPGEFVISKIFFIMLGPWQMHFQLKDQNEIIEEIIKDITI